MERQVKKSKHLQNLLQKNVPKLSKKANFEIRGCSSVIDQNKKDALKKNIAFSIKHLKKKLQKSHNSNIQSSKIQLLSILFFPKHVLPLFYPIFSMNLHSSVPVIPFYHYLINETAL